MKKIKCSGKVTNGQGLEQETWDRRNSNTHKTCYKCRINDERPTGQKHTTVGWDDGGKIGKIINQF